MGGYMLYFIVNEKSKSGNAKQIWKEIEEVLKVRNVSYQAFVSEYRGHAGKLAAEICAMDDNDICLVAVGGDGTANEVINGITDFEKVRFGVIPTGSGNDLAAARRIIHSVGNKGQLLLRGERCGFAGRAADDNGVDAAADLAIHQLL